MITAKISKVVGLSLTKYTKRSLFSTTFVKRGAECTLIYFTAKNINTNAPLQSSAAKTGFVIDPNPLISVAWMNSRPGLPWCSCFNYLPLTLLSPTDSNEYLPPYKCVSSPIWVLLTAQQVTSTLSLEAL